MLDELPGLFREWEVWAAQVLDSHLAYPILAFFRSSHDNESWISSLGAVLDASVLVQTAIDDVPRAPAEMMFKMEEHLVGDLGNFLRFDFTSEPGVERFEFEQARERLAAAGFHFTRSAAAWHGFTTRRGHYARRLNGSRAVLDEPAGAVDRANRSTLPASPRDGGGRRGRGGGW